jgi:hypothetical protein
MNQVARRTAHLRSTLATCNKIALDIWVGDMAMGIESSDAAVMRVENKDGNYLPEQDGTG